MNRSDLRAYFLTWEDMSRCKVRLRYRDQSDPLTSEECQWAIAGLLVIAKTAQESALTTELAVLRMSDLKNEPLSLSASPWVKHSTFEA